MNKRLQKKYAQLIIKAGVNVQKGQTLVIEAPVEVYEFAHVLSETAFEVGAKDVVIRYIDHSQEKIRATYLDEEALAHVEDWQTESMEKYFANNGCSLMLTSPNPHLMEDVAPEKGRAVQAYTNTLRNVVRRHITFDGMQWCIAAAPNLAWAKAIMPEEDESVVLDKFWDLIFKLAYIDEENDPVENWEKEQKRKGEIAKKLDSFKLDHIHMTSSNGTDITFGYSPKARYGSGGMDDPDKVKISPNIPSIEIATTPDKYRTNGVVYSTKPLILGGQICKNFCFTFKDGRVVDVKAEQGEELLRGVLATDEGANYLGEVAFVPYHSPISESGLIYFDTLIDENASCHLALGKGFPQAVGLNSPDLALWEQEHINYSAVHVDFMVGAPDTQIVGYTQDGQQVQIFKDGDFAF